jgi:hypothetical protein
MISGSANVEHFMSTIITFDLKRYKSLKKQNKTWQHHA